MHSLQEITDKWGNWLAEHYSVEHGRSPSVTVGFTSSTRYSDHKELGGYHDNYQCKVDFLSLAYDGRSPVLDHADVAYAAWYDNNGTIQQAFGPFRANTQTTRTFTWSVTESISVGVEIGVTAGVPGQAGGSGK